MDGQADSTPQAVAGRREPGSNTHDMYMIRSPIRAGSNASETTLVQSSASSTVDGSDSDGSDNDDDYKKEKHIDPIKDEKAANGPNEDDTPYHIFSRSQKKQMVFLVSLAGLFSPLSSNIYFPAMGSISRAFDVSMSLVALTVTVYMIVQGISPSFWGPFSDTVGRRPIFIGTFTIFLASNIGLALVPDFGGFMALRALQAAGSAATISIGAGVIGDITTPSERGSLIGIFGGVRMMGQSIGPVIGGILNQYLRYDSIFWFLLITGAISLLLLLVFLPETLRPIAGNGTVRLVGIQKPFINFIVPQKNVASEPLPSRPRIKLSDFFSPLRFLFEKDVFVTLLLGSVIYTVWSMVTSSTTSVLEEDYHLSNIALGLAFLPNGAGTVSGSLTIGYLMDWNYQRTVVEYRAMNDLPDEGKKITIKTHPNFPIEQARLRNSVWLIVVFIIFTAVYGYTLNVHLACPLVFQFFIAYTSTAMFSINSALMIDLYPGKSASATAVNNLIRCLLGAAGVAVIQPMINALGTGHSFLILAVITAALTPLNWVEIKWGGKWRQAREMRLAVAATEKAATTAV